MSARPETKRLHVEDLDLLLSRSLDGDLSVEEERELAELLQQDPAAARRRDELASIVTDLRKLPAAEPPFALGTRVAATAIESARGAGSFWHRFGLYPPPGLVLGGASVLALVLVSITLLRERDATPPAAAKPTQIAESRAPEGPVSVFFTEGQKEAKTQEQPSTPSMASSDQAAAPSASAAESRSEGPGGGASVADSGKVEAKSKDGERDKAAREESEPAAVLAESAPRRLEEARKGSTGDADALDDAKKSRADRRDRAAGFAPQPLAEADGRAVAQGKPANAPSETVSEPVAAFPGAVRSTSASEAGSGGRVAAPAPPAIAKLERQQVAPQPGVSLVGSASSAYRIAHAPSTELLSPGLDVTCTLIVDATGRVTGLRLPANAPDRALLERFLKAIVLEKTGASGPSAVDVRVVRP